MVRSAREILKALTSGNGSSLFYGDKRLDPGLTDPSKFGNWVLVQRITLGGVLDTSVPVSGDTLIRITGSVKSASSADYGEMRFNGDTSNNYRIAAHTGGSKHGNNATYTDNVRFGNLYTGDSATIFDLVFDPATPPLCPFTGAHMSRRAGHNDSLVHTGGVWESNGTKVTSVDFTTRNKEPISLGYIEVYEWQQLQPAELHSRELIKRIDVTGEFSHEFDVSDDEIIWVEYNVATSGNNNGRLKLYVNGVNTPDAYNSSYIAQNTGGSALTPYGHMTCKSENLSGTFTFYPKRNGTDNLIGVGNEYESHHDTGAAYNCYVRAVALPGVVENAHTLKITNDTTDGCDLLTSGQISIYRQVKTHLLTSNPGLLNGLAQQSTSDGATVTVQPGEIEIGGHVCRNTSPVDINLTDNLDSADTLSADTIYWLYAVRQGTRVTFVYSTNEPKYDRYNNEVPDIADRSPDASWHPKDSLAWRYIGQVKTVDTSGNVVPFRKCTPRVWESLWIPNGIPDASGKYTFPHGVGAAATTHDLSVMYRKPGTTDTITPLMPVLDDSGWHGARVTHINNSHIEVHKPSTPLFYDDDVYHSSADVKITLRRR